ncbi:MAG: response regulator transcription factor [Phycisphaerales bacterium]|jgi:DNA-binding NarL/FixJ family response regulator|nr:response regulator transcription factor [Phycisphaerales bacterium]
MATLDTTMKTAWAPEPTVRHDPRRLVTRVIVVGGQQITRNAIDSLLAGRGVDMGRPLSSEDELARLLQSDPEACDLIVLILPGDTPFGMFGRIGELLDQTSQTLSLVVLSEQASRGQVHAALRIGAKAFVNLDADPDELIRAIKMAAKHRVYLSPDAAELLVNDVSTAIDGTHGSHLPKTELSRREIEVVQLLCEGFSSKEIARQLHISPKTVENHRYNIYRKCEVDSIAALMRYAIHRGLVSV